jgi:prolyl-tRNA editing enzyme YbaK/EbsC (Cys-tRNA(Pro) deacylase)
VEKIVRNVVRKTITTVAAAKAAKHSEKAIAKSLIALHQRSYAAVMNVPSDARAV